MLNRRLASLLAAVTVAGLAATGCAEQSAAVRVDDRSVSRSDFEDSLDAIYEDDELRSVLFSGAPDDFFRAPDSARDSYSQEFVGSMLRAHVELLVVESTLEAEGIEVTDDDRASIESRLGSELSGGIDSVPDGVRDLVVDHSAGLNRLNEELGRDFNSVIGVAFDEADISVNTRYGDWDADELTIVPPRGPAGASLDGAGDGTGSAPG